jgi:hypothetical protein
MLSREWFLHLDNTPVHTAASVVELLAAQRVKTIPHLPTCLILPTAGFVLFLRVKPELVGMSLAQDTFKSSWEGAIRIITEEDFAFHWMEHCERCIRCASNYVKK